MFSTTRYSTRSIISAILVLCAYPAFAEKYVSKQGYSITVPAGWRLNLSRLNGTDAFMFLPSVDGYTPSINVAVVPANPKDNIPAAEKALASNYKHMLPQFHLSSQQVVHVVGHKAIETVGTFRRYKIQRMHVHQVIIISHKSDFTFTLTGDDAGWPKYQAAFAQTLKSLKIASP